MTAGMVSPMLGGGFCGFGYSGIFSLFFGNFLFPAGNGYIYTHITLWQHVSTVRRSSSDQYRTLFFKVQQSEN